MTPEERKLLKLLPKRYATVRSGRGGHIRVIKPNGNLLRFRNGPKTGLPVSISSSPKSDSYHKVIRDLKLAGVSVLGGSR